MVVAGAVLVVVAVALAAATMVGGATGALVAVGALSLLFTAVGGALFLLARRVGSRADDPEEVERRLAEGMDLGEEEYRGRQRGDDEPPEQSELDERFYRTEE